MGRDGVQVGRWRRRAADVGLVVGLVAVVRVGFAPWYSSPLLDRAAFVHQYRHGVYGHRLLGREAVLWLERAIGDPLGEHLVLAGRHPLAGGMATAGIVVDLVAAAAIALLVGHLLDRRSLPEPARWLVVLTLGVLVALSATAVTPYDLPALALALGALVATDARRPLDLGSIPLLVAAVATRESALVAVAALVARWWCERDGGAAPRRSRPSFVAAFAAAGVATYLVLLAATDDGALWAQLALRGNVGRLYGWFGLAAMVGGWCLWRRAMVLAGLDGQGARREVRWMWLLASPYVVVALLTGYWFEVRLLLPMLVAELWVRAGAAPVAPVPPAGSGAGRDGAPELEAHG